MSGAPSIQAPWSVKDAALHLRAEENGTVSTSAHPGGRSYSVRIASRLGLGWLSDAARAASAAPVSMAWPSPRCSTLPSTRSPSVRVPVLSRQITSTRARPSMAASSWVSTFWRARRVALTAKAMLVSSTSPSGTMATRPATEACTASIRPRSERICAVMSSAAVGSISQPTHLMIWLMPSRSSDFTRVKRRASALSLNAYDSVPTRVAVMCPLPEDTKLPERTSAPTALSTGSASPVRSDSSISSPVPSSTSPSTLIWSPGRRTIRSPRTSSFTAISPSVPSRITAARGALRTASRSSARLERTSCTMPMSVLATSTMPNSASRYSPTAMITTSNEPSRKLNGVSTLARTISVTVRLVGSGTSLVYPSALCRSTSARVSPVSVAGPVAASVICRPAPRPRERSIGAAGPRSHCRPAGGAARRGRAIRRSPAPRRARRPAGRSARRCGPSPAPAVRCRRPPLGGRRRSPRGGRARHGAARPACPASPPRTTPCRSRRARPRRPPRAPCAR